MTEGRTGPPAAGPDADSTPVKAGRANAHGAQRSTGCPGGVAVFTFTVAVTAVWLLANRLMCPIG